MPQPMIAFVIRLVPNGSVSMGGAEQRSDRAAIGLMGEMES